MATGNTSFSDISALVNNIQEGSLRVLRNRAVVAMTVTPFSAVGMNPRKGYDWGQGNVRAVGEGEDVTSTKFDKSLRVTLTPARHADQFDLTDERVETDWEDVRRAAAVELGEGHAQDVDSNLTSNFSSLTGGTIGTAGGTLGWGNIIAAQSKLRQLGVYSHLYCVLGEGVWYHLRNNVAVTGGAFSGSDRIVTAISSRMYTVDLLQDVTIVVSGNVSGNAGTASTNAMYPREALALDIRERFNIEPERDASRKTTELNSNMRYAHGTWAPARGVQLLGTDVIP